jgi:carboxyl-terminal processing protease
MKNSLTVLAFVSINAICSSQTNVKSLLDTVLFRTKETSMYVETIDWDSLQNQVYLKAENAMTVQDLKPALEILLNGLRDHHGRFLDATDYSTLAYFTDYKNQRIKDTRIRDLEIWKVMNDTALRFEYKVLQSNIGYLKIVGIGPNVDIQEESEKIRNAVIELSKEKIEHWIIDLRYNGGGNMYPMVSGIAPIIGDGTVGKLMSAKNETLFNWTIKNGNFTYDVSDVVKLPNKPKFKSLPKVAVLTSRWTASSGEIVATTLKGRPDTMFFGEATGGYTTNASWEIIEDKIIMVISTGTYCDRNGVMYDRNIPVDIEIPFEVVEQPEKDKCIIEAINWLNEK